MSFLDGLDFITEFLSIRNDKISKKNRLIISLFVLILCIGALFFLFTVKLIFNLFHPVFFLLQFGLIGFIISIGLIIVMYKINWIEQISSKDFLIISIATCLSVVSLAGMFNYKYSIKSLEYKSYFIVRIDKEVDLNKLTVDKNGQLIKLEISSESAKQMNLNPYIKIQEAKGFLGYNYVGDFSF